MKTADVHIVASGSLGALYTHTLDCDAEQWRRSDYGRVPLGPSDNQELGAPRRANLRFLAEFFKAWNHASFGNPATV